MLVALMGVQLATAADLEYYETKDRSYIDRTLDDFERRTGQRQYNKYEDHKNDYSRNKGHSYNAKPNYKQRHWQGYEQNRKWQDECLPKRKIRKKLIKRGWHDFHIIKRGPRRVKLLATNFNGRRFKLVINACAGHIIRRIPMRRYWGWN